MAVAGAPERAAVPSAAERLRDVRRWRRATVQGPSLAKRADAVYTVLIVVAIFGSLVYDTAHTALGEVLTVDGAATWGPAALLLALVVVARWGAYQGPVVYAVADVGHLLGAPLSRRGLASRRLLRAFASGAAVGALLGGIAVIGLDGQGGGVTTARDVGLVGGLAAIGVIGVAAAAWVQGSARAERALGPLTLLALMAAAGLGSLGRDDAGVLQIERWSGPWGWATAPVGTGSWATALGLLGVTTVLAAGVALARCGRCATERHVRRAEARASAVASLVSFDARSTRRALDTATSRRAPRGASRRAGSQGAPRGVSSGATSPLRPSARRPELLLAWRDLTALRRTPARVAEAVVLTAAATAVMVTAADRPAAALLGGLALYVGATRLLEPLRQEIDVPGRTQLLLPGAWGEVLYQHTFLPMALVGATVVVAGAVVAAAGASLPDGGALVACAVVGAPVTVLAAALSARRGGRVSTSVVSIASADPSGMGAIGIVGWVALWPIVGALCTGIPVALVGHAGATNLPWGLALGVLATLGLASTLRTTERP